MGVGVIVEILNAADVVTDEVHQLMSANATRRISESGDFTFSVAQSDPALVRMTYRTMVRMIAFDTGERRAVAIGRIVDYTEDTDSGVVDFSCDGVAMELNGAYVDDLLLSQDTDYFAAWYEQHDGVSSDGSAGASANTLTFSDNEFLYIGYPTRHRSALLTISSGLSSNAPDAGVIDCQYVRSDTEGKYYWDSVTGFTDATQDASGTGTNLSTTGRPLAQTGRITYTAGDSWEKTFHNNRTYYWIRIQYDIAAVSEDVTIASVHISADGLMATDDALDAVFGTPDFPAGWSVDHTTHNPVSSGERATTYNGVDNGVYYQFSGETITEALEVIRNQTGHDYYLNGREVVWLYDLSPDSGVSAIGVHSGTNSAAIFADDTRALVMRGSKRTSSAEYCSHVIPTGAGVDDAALTLESATWTAPPGYTLASASNYIKHDSNFLADRYGAKLELKDIGSSDGEPSVAAANALAAESHRILLQRVTATINHDLTIGLLTAQLHAGARINIDGVRLSNDNDEPIYNFDGDLVIIEIVENHTSGGVEYELKTSETRTRPLTDENFQIENIKRQRRAQRTVQPLNYSAIRNRFAPTV